MPKKIIDIRNSLCPNWMPSEESCKKSVVLQKAAKKFEPFVVPKIKHRSVSSELIAHPWDNYSNFKLL